MEMKMEKIKKSTVQIITGDKREIDPETAALIDDVLGELLVIAKDKVVYDIYDATWQGGKLTIGNTGIEVESKSLERFIGGAEKVILLATTLGNLVEKKLNLYGKTAISKAYIYDLCAMVYIESILDAFEEAQCVELAGQGYYISCRFSPGYGDLSLDLQSKLIEVLNAQKTIGLTVNASNIMIPRKSVTAIIGLKKEPFTSGYSSCDSCMMRERCTIKEGNGRCGFSKED